VLTFAILTLLFLLFVMLVSRAAARPGRAQSGTGGGARTPARPGGAPEAGGPFEVMVGQHSYRLDEKTGRWVEITHETPDRPWPGPRQQERATHKREKE
jgi:hypothetical protein